MVPEEIDADSEAVQESIDRWQKTCSQKVSTIHTHKMHTTQMPTYYTLFLSHFQMIDDFTDVNRGEKEMMKLWNLFAMEHG